MTFTKEVLNNFTIEELQNILSVKNATLYELKSIYGTLLRQNTDNDSEKTKIKEIKKDIELIQDVLLSKRETNDATIL